MSNNNDTYYYRDGEGYSIENPRRRNCMENVKSTNGTTHVIIPFNILNPDISHEDVLRWIEIGNSLIFKANCKLVNSNTASKPSNIQELVSNDIKIVLKNRGAYSRYDAYKACEGFIVHISDYKKGRVKVSKSHDNIVGARWDINFIDFKVESTGQCAEEYLKQSITYKDSDTIDGYNSYAISFTGSDCISSAHKLSVMTFYRYLYSGYYTSIVKDTLKIIDSGISPWNALMITHCAYQKSYTSGYGLTFPENNGIPSMKYVMDNFRKGYNVNKSFHTAAIDKHKRFYIKSIDDFKAIEKELLPVNMISKSVTCINDINCKTLTKNKTYTVVEINRWGEYKVKADDYSHRWFLNNRFSK